MMRDTGTTEPLVSPLNYFKSLNNLVAKLIVMLMLILYKFFFFFFSFFGFFRVQLEI